MYILTATPSFVELAAIERMLSKYLVNASAKQRMADKLAHMAAALRIYRVYAYFVGRLYQRVTDVVTTVNHHDASNEALLLPTTTTILDDDDARRRRKAKRVDLMRHFERAHFSVVRIVSQTKIYEAIHGLSDHWLTGGSRISLIDTNFR